ncbi:hypothetical protein ACFL0Z_03665, partial [Patescibacteria group bacterium]
LLLPVFRSWAVIISLLVLAVLAIVMSSNFREVVSISYDGKAVFETSDYPVAAVEYLRENPIEGNMLNEYNWGGYLIWTYPEAKVFVDGRTPHWREGEEQLLQKYLALKQGEENVTDLLNKYDVTYVLLMPGRPLLNYLADRDDYWEEVYRDEIAVIMKQI